MIRLHRSFVLQFAAVARAAGIAAGPGEPSPPVQLQASCQGLLIRMATPQLILSWLQPDPYQDAQLVVPLGPLLSCGRGDEQVVTLQQSGSSVAASWSEGRCLRQVTLPSPTLQQTGTDLAQPPYWAPAGDGLLVALRNASATAATRRGYYALDCISMRGGHGSMVATDGRQMLLQRGFQFPWPGNLLVPASRVFGSEVLASATPCYIGRTQYSVWFRFGNWTIGLPADRRGPFPEPSDVLPCPASAITRVHWSAQDLACLVEALPQRPRIDGSCAAVTFDVNGRIQAFTEAGEAAGPIALQLVHSYSQGQPLRIRTQCSYLHRALELGFREMLLFGPDQPVVLHDGHRTLAWALLKPQPLPVHLPAQLEPAPPQSGVTPCHCE